MKINTTNFPIRQAKPFPRAFRWFAPRTEPRLVLRPAMPSVPGLTPQVKKILIVDDDAVIVKTTSLKLEAHGYEVVTASDCSGAIQAVRREKPDLILLDLNFPAYVGAVAWDGFLLMSWLGRLPEAKDIPVIIISGEEPARNKDRSLACGALAFFQKPINHNGLLSVIQEALNKNEEWAKPAPVFDFSV
jgi:CheY-like chemotaxis protein